MRIVEMRGGSRPVTAAIEEELPGTVDLVVGQRCRRVGAACPMRRRVAFLRARSTWSCRPGRRSQVDHEDATVRQAQPPPDDPSWRAGGLAALLPVQVCVEELRGDLAARRDELLPGERDVMRHAVERRRAEFAAVRGCARRALARLGVAGGAILPGGGGAPVWPPDVVGSMTHTDGYCAAAVASATQVRALGIDAELHDRLEEGVRDLVLSDAERMGLGALPPGTCWDMVSFSAKEAVFKAWYPLTRSRLGFQDVVLRIDPERGTFLARVLPVAATPGAAPPGVSFQGRFALQDPLILTAVAVLRH